MEIAESVNMGRRFRVLLVAAGLGVIALLVVRTGPMLLLEMLWRVGWSFVAIVFIYAAHVVLRALALWRGIIGPAVRFVDVLRVRLSVEAVEVLTYTGPFLAEPAKGWLLTRRGLSAAEAFASVATEYLLYTTVSAILALGAFSLLATSDVVPVLARPAALTLATIMAAFIGAVCFAVLSGIGLIVPITRATGAVLGRRRMARLADVIEPAERMLVSFLHERPTRVAEILAIEAVGHSLLMAEIWIVLSTLGLAFSAVAPLIVEGGGKLTAVAFFFIPGQLGATEAVYAALLRTVGLSASVGLTLALVRRVRSLCVAGVGLLVLTWFGDR
jgi:hypothetical protein